MKRKVIRTEADLLEHSYGVKAEVVEPAPTPPAPEPAPEPPPPPPADPESTSPPGLSDDEQALVDKFVNNYSKDELIGLATDNEIDSSGTKADIAARLVKAGWAPYRS
jgi:hypothetical protein